jgi:hypothetical protein
VTWALPLRAGGVATGAASEALRAFFSAVDAGIGAFNSGRAFAPETLQNVVRLVSARAPRRG